jgi:uncharacterized protein involved in outer membrane biogenesis
MLRKVLYVVVGLVVLLVAAVLIGPSFVDWNKYKPEITAAAEEQTGRTLAIDGDISLSVLPAPTLTAEGVRFANVEGASTADMVTLQALDVRVALIPLLSGDIKVERVTLVDPVIVLEAMADGTNNWTFNPPAAADGATGETTTGETTTGETTTEAPAGEADAAAPTGSGMQISLDRLSIENGTLIYIDHAAVSEQRIESLDATIEARSLQGPFRIQGDAIAASYPLEFDIGTGAIVEGAPIDLSATIGLAETDARVTFNGTVATGETIAVDGKLDGSASDVGKVMAALGGQSTPALEGQKFALTGTIASTPEAIRMDDLDILLGDNAATGSFEATTGDPMAFKVKLAMGRLDADALMAAFGGAGGDRTEAADDAADDGAGFALPTGINAEVDLSIEAVTLKGGVVENVKLVATLLPEGLLGVKQFTAQLPGGSAISLAGDVAPADGEPSFAGVLEASSDNLRALLGWLGVDVAAVPSERLRNLAFASRVTATPNEVQLGEIDMRLDNSKVAGGIVIAMPNATRAKPAFGIGLALDQINVDAYMPAAAAETTERPAESDGGGNPLSALAPLADLDANVELRVGSLTLNGQQVEGLHVDGTLQGGTLTLRDLSVTKFAGGAGTITGTLTDLAGDPRYDMNIDVDVADATRAMQLAGMADAPADLGRMTINGTLAGGARDVAYDLAFTIEGIGAQGSAKGTAAGLDAGIPRIDSVFSLDAGDAGPLFALAGVPVPDGADLGALSVSGNAKSGEDDLIYDVTLSLTGAGAQGSFKGTASGLSGDTPRVDTVLDLQAGQPTLLLALAGIEPPEGVETLGALGLSGTLKGDADDMALDVDLTALGGTASIAGTVAQGEAGTALDLNVTADHPEFKQLLAALSPDAAASAQAVGPLKLAAAIDGTTQNLKITGLDLTAGATHLTGDVAADMSGTRPQLTATLNGDTVDVTPFMGPGGGEGGGGGDGSPWSSEPLDLAVLDSFDGTFDVKAQSFIAGETRIDNLDARVLVRDGVMTVERMTGNVYGGSFDLSGTRVNGRGTPTASIVAVANNLDSGQLAGGGIMGATFSGPISFNGNFDTTGASLNEMMHALDGTGNVDGTIKVLTSTQQAIGSALLGVLGQQVQQLRGITDTMNALFAGFTGRDNSLTGDFIVTDGVLQTDNARLANEAASLLGQGTADIGNWTMDMLAEIYRQQTGDVPFMALDLTGPLGGPNVALREGAGVTPEGVTPTGLGLVEQVLPGMGTGEGTAEDGIGGLIQDIIPGADEEVPAGEVIDPDAPGAEGLTTVAPDETTETGAEPAAEAIEEEIVPEAEPGAESDAVEPLVEEQPAEVPAVEEQPSADVAPGAEGLTTEPAAEPEVAPVEEPAVDEQPAAEEPIVEEQPAAEEPVVEEQPAADEPVVEEQPAAEEPAAEEAPGASGLTTEPAEPAAEEVPAEEPAAEESPGASGTTIEPAAEPSAEPAAPGSEGAEPGAEPVPETQGQDGTTEDPAQQLLQGILSTD